MLLQPAALGLLALIPIVVVFYILRAQHQQQYIPSTLFWRHISSDLEGRPSRRFPLRSLLLLLQIVVVSLLALALARPSVLGGAKRHLVLVLDASVSMQATDVEPSRFEEAKRKGREMIAKLAAGDEVTLVRAGRNPSVLESSSDPDRSAVLAALASAAPSGGVADIGTALSLATSLTGQHRDAANEVVVLSDGVFSRVDPSSLGPAGASIRLELVGQSARNVAVTELSVRPLLGTVGRHVAFVRVLNYGDAPAEAPFTTLADGIAIETRQLQLPARGAVELTVGLPTGTKVVGVHLKTNDFLSVDDDAQAIVGPDRQLNVTLVSSNTLFWDRVLRAIPRLKVTKVRASAYKPLAADIVIFDGFEPPASLWPSANVLLVNPLGDPRGDAQSLPVPSLGDTGPVQVVRASTASPLLDSVELGTLVLSKSVLTKLPTWAHSVADSAAGPLILEGQFDGRSVVAFAFDPSQSELPQRLAFPVLVANTLGWLAPTDLPTAVRPGSIVDVQPLAGASEVIVRMPGGKAQAFQARSGVIHFAQTDSIGRYQVTQRGESGVLAQSTFVVNVTDENASDIRPRADSLGGGVTGTAGSATPGVRAETWPYLAGAVLVVLSGEWLYYCKRKA